MKNFVARTKRRAIRLYYLLRYGDGAFPVELRLDEKKLHFTSYAAGNKVSLLVYDISGAYALPFAALRWNRENWNTVRTHVDGMFACAEKDARELERQEDAIEKGLTSILSNPTLAEAAFPDPEVRSKILPLFQSFRVFGQKNPTTQEA